MPAPVARRRRLFFAACTVVLAATVGTAVMTARLTAPSALTSKVAVHTSARALLHPSGCTLRAGTVELRLTIELARRLTDLAGTDQNAGASVVVTEQQLKVVWPAQQLLAHEVARSLRGLVPGALACTGMLGPATRQSMSADGLTPRANAMWDAVKAVFGPLPAGGFMPGGVHVGHVPGSAHYEGRAVDFFYRPVTEKTISHGWVLAQWLEAHASALGIATVIFDARAWTPQAWNAKAWTAYVYPEGPTSNPTLLHYDHVHVDVQRGG